MLDCIAMKIETANMLHYETIILPFRIFPPCLNMYQYKSSLQKCINIITYFIFVLYFPCV